MTRRATHTIRRHLAEPLNRTAWGLMASALLTSVLGVGFWALAARVYPASVVGRDAALIASLATVSSICQLNLGNVIVRFVPQIRERLPRRVLEAYGAAASVSLLGGLLFVVAAPLASEEFDFLRDGPWLGVIYAFSVASWTIFVLQDAVLTALGRAPWLALENGLFAMLKIAALPATFLLIGGHGVFVAWVIPMLAMVPLVNWLIARRVLPRAREAQRKASGVVELIGRRRLLAFLTQDFLGTALAQAAMTALPVLVVALLGAEANAYFYIPFILATTFDMMFFAVTTSLTTEGARSPQRAHELARTVIGRFFTLQVPAAALIVLAAPLILVPFGPDYVENGTGALRLLVAASCCRALLFIFAAVARLQAQGGRLLALQVLVNGVLIALVALLAPHYGLNGVGMAWLIANGTAALAVVPALVAFLRDPGAHPSRVGPALALRTKEPRWWHQPGRRPKG